MRATVRTRRARTKKRGTPPPVHVRRIQTQSGSWVTERLHYDKVKYHHDYALIRSSLREWVYLHRVIVEGAVGRWLKKREEVHHLDGDRQNNSRDNLLVCSRKYHRALHERCKEVHGTWHLPQE